MLALALKLWGSSHRGGPASTAAVELADDDGTTYLMDDDGTAYLTDD